MKLSYLRQQSLSLASWIVRIESLVLINLLLHCHNLSLELTTQGRKSVTNVIHQRLTGDDSKRSTQRHVLNINKPDSALSASMEFPVCQPYVCNGITHTHTSIHSITKLIINTQTSPVCTMTKEEFPLSC